MEVEPLLPFDSHAETERTRVQPSVDIICGDVMDVLQDMPDGSVHCVITSPPYYGLRDYGVAPRVWDDKGGCDTHQWGKLLPPHHPGQVEQTNWKNAVAAGAGQTLPSGQRCQSCDAWFGVLGQEPTLELYIQHMVEIMRELKRVLHPRGSLWLNIGDCYAGGGRHDERKDIYDIPTEAKPRRPRQKKQSGKSLLMVPARTAIALAEDGWILRQDNIWAKALSFLPAYAGSVMPESTRDRTTWAHEHVFHLTLSEQAFYDQDGYREPYADSSKMQLQSVYHGKGRKDYAGAGVQDPSNTKRRVLRSIESGSGRNLRNVWVIPKQNFPGAHFATFSEKLVEPVVRLATSEHGVCEVCLEPWARRVTRETVPAPVRAQFEAARATTAGETGRTDGHTSKRPNYRRRVLREDWDAGCQCGRGVIPATVMDIFCGSGRAGIVAKRLGRSFVGIDVNPEYCKMAIRAIGVIEK